MKRLILFIVCLVAFGSAFSQTGNDTTKYTWYKFTYGIRYDRLWGSQVVDIPNDTIFSKYGLSKKGGSLWLGDGTKWNRVSGTNIYNSNGDITDDRYLGGPLVAGAATKSLFFDSLLNFEVNSSGAGGGMLIHGHSGSSFLEVGQNEIDGTVFNVPFSNASFFQFLGDSTHLRDYAIGGDTSYLTITPGSITFYQGSGAYKFRKLIQSNDSTLKKPLAADALGNLYQLDHWPGSGGGGSAPVVQTITAGPTVTINNSTDILQVNSTSLIASLTVTLPATYPTNKQVKICFTANGTITSGNTMVTSITIVNGSGHTISQAVNPNGSSALAGENLVYQLIGTVEQRLQ